VPESTRLVLLGVCRNDLLQSVGGVGRNEDDRRSAYIDSWVNSVGNETADGL
jgi:hypothetical protein